MKRFSVASIIILLSLAAGFSETTGDFLYTDMARRIDSLIKNKRFTRPLIVPFSGKKESETEKNRTAAKNLARACKTAGHLHIMVSPSPLPGIEALMKRSSSFPVNREIPLKRDKGPAPDLLLFCGLSRTEGKNVLSLTAFDPAGKKNIMTAAVWAAGPRHGEKAADDPDNTGNNKETSLLCSISDLVIHPVKGAKKNTFYISGRVKNESGSILKRPAVTVLVLSRGGKKFTARAVADRDLFPGETLPVRGIVRGVSLPVIKKKVRCTTVKQVSTSYRRGLFLLEKTIKKTGRYIEIHGRIQNKSKKSIYFPALIASFLDKEKKFLGSARGFARKKILSPEKSTSFIIRIKKNALTKMPSSYIFQFSGRAMP